MPNLKPADNQRLSKQDRYLSVRNRANRWAKSYSCRVNSWLKSNFTLIGQWLIVLAILTKPTWLFLG